ncbi:ribose 5-phosphate isomerase A [Microbispora rosea]|uniref:ribose 5-phosphate isomerase A n=1 Tax=Microbispora rosea TaxID=58117 RepID=UPI003D90A8E4
MDVDQEKRLAAEAAAEIVENGMTVGLGTGSTVGYLLPALARRGLSISCVATSPRTMRAASELGLDVKPFDSIDHLDITIDGADQIAPDGWLVKGGGGAHTREKIVAAAASRFIVIGDSRKLVDVIRAPIPLELLEFGLPATLRRLEPVVVREGPKSPDGGILADYHGDVEDPARLSQWLSATPGVVGHGLFPPELVASVLIGRGDSVERRTVRERR